MVLGKILVMIKVEYLFYLEVFRRNLNKYLLLFCFFKLGWFFQLVIKYIFSWFLFIFLQVKRRKVWEKGIVNII